MSIKIIVGQKAIAQKIAGIRRAGKALDNSIHVCAVSIIAHVEEHGDTSLANRLVDAMPKGARVNALLAWFEEFGKLRYSEEKKELRFNKEGTTDINSGTAKPWYEFKKEAPYKGWDDIAELKRLIARMGKVREDDDEEHQAQNKLNDELYNKLQGLVS